MKARVLMLVLMVIAMFSFSACGGGSATTTTPVTYTIGGTVSGLSGTGLVLQNNSGNNLAVSANGAFTFTAAVASGGSYSVAVLTQPSSPTQTCVVTSGSGTANASVTGVQVACTTNTYTIGGTVSGLSGTGLVLQNNSGNNLAVSANGVFTFTAAVASGGSYAVTVLTQPSSLTQTCVVSGGSGSVTSANITSVQVTCTTNTYTIGGTITGLSGTGLVLQDNGGNNLSVSPGATSFTFTTAIASGSTYAVTAFSQPSSPTQTCAVASGSGSVTNASIASVHVTCTTNTYTIGGTITGLSSTGLVLLDNGGNNLSVSAGATSFTFTTAIASGSTYAVTVFSQPSGPPAQTCGITNGSGTVTSGNITSVALNCVTTPFTALTATMKTARYGDTATLLPNGKVLIAGGFSGNFTGLNTAEVYDPVANTFTALSATMTTPRYDHAATLLPSGKVLITGGLTGSTVLNTAEVYDPVANTFTALTATMTAPRLVHAQALLPNGKVLITGGVSILGGPGVNTAEVYDYVANTFTALTATMTTARAAHAATLLPNGKVLLTGGWTLAATAPPFNTAEVYDYVANTFTALTVTTTTPRTGHTATLLRSGKVLITGGFVNGGDVTGTAYNTAEVYDYVANTFTALTATMTSIRAAHTATLLPNGFVLIAGGTNGLGTPGNEPAINTAEVYAALPPSVNTFTALTAAMTTVRTDHAATLLPSGLVLLTGGDNNSTALNTAELYNPTTQTFTTLTATMTVARMGHTATLLPNGQVLIAGGFNNTTSFTPLNSAELYDPVANTFIALTATMTSAREQHAAVLLANGLVLIAGGWNSSLVALNTAELYDPVAKTFTALTSTMTLGRAAHTLTLLPLSPNGQVLVAGGSNVFGVSTVNTAELYDPVANTFTALTATMTSRRGAHAATLLPNGQVLIAGGFNLNGSGVVLNTAEVYNPVANTFTALATTMTSIREFPAATLLPNGQVLITGGSTNGSTAFTTGLNSAELYQP